jgi:hypothetical protein
MPCAVKLPPHRHVTRLQFSFLPANGIGKARRRPGRHHAPSFGKAPSEMAEHGSARVASVFRVHLRLAVAAGTQHTTVAASSRRAYLRTLHPSGMSGTAGASRPSVPSRCNATRPGLRSTHLQAGRDWSSANRTGRPFIAWQRCARPRVGAAIIRGSQQQCASVEVA